MARVIFRTFDDDSILGVAVCNVLGSIADIATLKLPKECRDEIAKLLISAGETTKEMFNEPRN